MWEEIVAVKSECGSGLIRFGIGLGKALVALRRLIEERLESRPSFLGALTNTAEGKFDSVLGGVLVDDRKDM